MGFGEKKYSLCTLSCTEGEMLTFLDKSNPSIVGLLENILFLSRMLRHSVWHRILEMIVRLLSDSQRKHVLID